MTASITIIRYPKRYITFAFLAMAIFRIPLQFSKRSRFWKLMGSGKNGSFDKRPDLQQWAILSVSNIRFKEVQLKNYKGALLLQKLYGKFISRWLTYFNCETVTYLLESIEGHGLWDGKKAFGDLPKKTEYDGQIAILTRATIRFSKLKDFWKHVEGAASKMAGTHGFIISYGIGEIPWIKQATFSIWENKEAMRSYAYRTPEHQEVIQKTRSEDWYKEEMFVRFKITGCIGSLKGVNPLKENIKQVTTSTRVLTPLKKNVLPVIFFFFCLNVCAQKSYNYSVTQYQKNYASSHEVVRGANRKFFRFYAPDEQYKFSCRFERSLDSSVVTMHTSGKLIPTKDFTCYGRIVFTWHDSAFQLRVYQSVSGDKNHLFIPFTDLTTGDETYGSGRYIDLMVTDIVNNQVEVDFNKAYNPYCAYTSGYNCPIPPRDNYLPLQIKAGEKTFAKSLVH